MKGTCQNYFLRDYWILLLFFYAITLRCIYLVVMYGRHICKRGLSVGIFNETVINPPAELGRLTDAGGGEQSIKIENSAV